jgi:hypothetical protein
MPGVHNQTYICAADGFRVGDKDSNVEVITEDGLLTDCMVEEITLTNAEIKALLAAPKELVAAPGAGKLIQFLGAVLFHDYGSNALTGNHDLTLGLNDGAVPVAAVIGFGDFPLKAADHIYVVQPGLALNGTAATTLNQNLALLGAGNYGGNAAADTVWRIKVAYRILDFS